MRLSSVLVAMPVLLGGCGGPEPAAVKEQAPVSAPAVADPPALPTVLAPLTRRDLILAAVEAASDAAAGTGDAQRQRQLAGRTFSFRIRLCEGAPSRGRMAFDREDRVLRISIPPDFDADDPVARALGSDRFEAVEGFWVPYPWLLQAACPPAAASSADPNEAPQPGGAEPAPTVRPTLALGQFFSPGTDRSVRRAGRPYNVTQRLREGEEPQAVDLVLQGRLAGLNGGKVITCVTDDTALPPQCVISVRFDTVQLARVGDGEVLGEWSSP